MNAATLLFTPLFAIKHSAVRPISLQQPTILKSLSLTQPVPVPSRLDFRAWADDGDADEAGPDDYDMDEEDVKEADNKKDFDIDYDTAASKDGEDDIAMVDSKSFVYTQGWDSEKIVDYRINEEEFHKICLLDCDFFIRKPPDPDNDVYDFREMYVTPPDTDVYAIPKILAPMPQKYIRCAKSNYGGFNVTEPPVDALRDPLYKTEHRILKVFLTKHYRNRRFGDPEFVLDFEEIYVIDSKSKSITRAKVVVEVPERKDRDRKNDLIIFHDKGNSFTIIPSGISLQSKKPPEFSKFAISSCSLSPEDTRKLVTKVKEKLEKEHNNLPVGKYGRDDEGLIFWFLKDRKFSVEDTVAKLTRAIRWRHEFGVSELSEESVKHVAESGKAYIHDYLDVHGRPTLIVDASKHFPGDYSPIEDERLCVFMIEKALSKLPDGKQELLVIMGLRGFKAQNADMRFLSFVFDAFYYYYPRRLGQVVFVDAPFIFKPFWKLVKPLLKSYASLVRFCPSKTVKDEYFTSDTVPACFRD